MDIVGKNIQARGRGGHRSRESAGRKRLQKKGGIDSSGALLSLEQLALRQLPRCQVAVRVWGDNGVTKSGKKSSCEDWLQVEMESRDGHRSRVKVGVRPGIRIRVRIGAMARVRVRVRDRAKVRGLGLGLGLG